MLGDGIRRNIATVSKEERDRFRDAILALGSRLFPGAKTDSVPGGVSYWFKQDEIHDSTHVHFCPAFLPWHRELMNRFEGMLQEIDPQLSLHYWDWTADPQALTDSDGNPLNLFTADFMGNAIGPGSTEIEIGNPWNAATGKFYGGPGPFRDDPGGTPADPPQLVTRQVGALGPLIPPADEHTLLGALDFVAFDDQMEGGGVNVHGQGHTYIGGDLLDPHTSFRDPFVFLMHSNIDRLWAMWQRQPGHPERLDPAQVYKAQSSGRNGFENTKGGDRTTIDPPGVPQTGDNSVTPFLRPWWGILSPLEPWAGPGSTAQTAATGIIANVNSVRPWVPAFENEQVFKDSRDPSIVIPPSYDTCPHSSYIIVNQDTFSDSQLATLGSPATVSKAFYVVYEGFEPKELGVTSAPLPSVPPNLPVFTFAGASHISAVNPSAIYEAPGGAIDMPQRITIAYDLQFASTADFPGVVNMRATLTYNVDTGTGGSVVSINEIANATLVLVNQPNPYMIDVDPALSPPNPYWLSTDTRVFQVKGPGGVNPAGSVLGVTQGNADTDANAPFTFINGVLSALRMDPSQFNDVNFSEDENASVLELSHSVGMPPNTQRVYNYAIARVRYRAPVTIDAANVQVFFRAFSTMVSALDYDSTSGTTGNYRRTGNTSGSMPLLGIENNQVGTAEIASIPFFAAARQANMALQTDATNVQTITGNGAEQVAFFGCWLDLNQTEARFPRFPLTDPGGPNGPFTGATAGNPLQSIQQLMTGYHECLVAEVFFWPTGTTGDPIPLHAGPGSSDRLAQRNMSIVASGNPGWPVTHTVQHTFLVKPSVGFVDQAPAGAAAVGIRNFGPDELMVQWNNVPRESSATFYFPEIEVDEILKLSALRQHPEVLSKVDAHTLTCRLADVTFIPLPPGRNGNLAGLISLTLPPWIKVGQTYRLNMQQYSGVNRKILGAFQLTVPVKNEPDILPSEIRKLSVLRYIQQSIPSGNRWSLIFQRYVQQIADRVDAFGGNSSQVGPSPNGDGKDPNAAKCRFWGRVTGVLLAALVVALGTLSGTALTTTTSVLALILVAVALLWFAKCHPKPCSWLRIFIGGAATGAAVLAIFALLGITTLQTVPILSVVVILVVIAILVGAVQKCF